MKFTSVISILCALFATILVSADVPKIPLNAPANNSTDVQLNPNCTWKPMSSVDSYWFEVSDSTAVNIVTGEFTTKSRNHKFSMKTDNFWQIRAALHPSTKYYWHVMAKKDNELGPWSDMWNFTTTNVVDKPYQISPDEDALMVDQPIAMTFMKVPNATKYHMQVTNMSNNKTVIDVQDILDNNGNPQKVISTVSNLSGLTQYSWRVRCMVNNIWGKWTDSINFTTGESLAAPTLLTPANGAANQGTNTLLTFKIVNNQSYKIQISKDKTFNLNVGNFTNSTGTQSVADMEYSTTYYWRVRSESDLSTGVWSKTWSFTTVAPATSYSVDLAIKAILYGNGSNNIGENQPDANRTGTYFAILEANALKKAVFYINVKNSGNIASNIDLSIAAFDAASTAKLPKWSVKFTNSSGKDLTKSVTNTNVYRVESLAAGASVVYRLEVSPSSGVINNDAISILVRGRVAGAHVSYTGEDSVKAVTVKTARGNK